MNNNNIRTLYARQHDTVFPKLGVFLAGSTPSEANMLTGWRRVVAEKLKQDKRLNASMIVVYPEPESGLWSDIDNPNPQNEVERMRDKQIPWEWQYLSLCDITAFWLPTYWSKEQSGVFDANIGPTSRLEFGYFLQEALKSPQKRKFIVGSPADAESLKWAQKMASVHNIHWHILPEADKEMLVAPSFIEEIASTLAQNQWDY